MNDKSINTWYTKALFDEIRQRYSNLEIENAAYKADVEKITSANTRSLKLLARLHEMVMSSPLAGGYAMSNLIKEVREQLQASA